MVIGADTHPTYSFHTGRIGSRPGRRDVGTLTLLTFLANCVPSTAPLCFHADLIRCARPGNR